MKSFEAMAREAYRAFLNAVPDGASRLPTWEDMAEPTREAWRVATRKVVEQVQQVH